MPDDHRGSFSIFCLPKHHRLGGWFSGGDLRRWHRLDNHLAAILAFDADHRLRMLTLAQHNHQQTFIPLD
jgi:hypothetical protein